MKNLKKIKKLLIEKLGKSPSTSSLIQAQGTLSVFDSKGSSASIAELPRSLPSKQKFPSFS